MIQELFQSHLVSKRLLLDENSCKDFYSSEQVRKRMQTARSYLLSCLEAIVWQKICQAHICLLQWWNGKSVCLKGDIHKGKLTLAVSNFTTLTYEVMQTWGKMGWNEKPVITFLHSSMTIRLPKIEAIQDKVGLHYQNIFFYWSRVRINDDHRPRVTLIWRILYLLHFIFFSLKIKS